MYIKCVYKHYIWKFQRGWAFLVCCFPAVKREVLKRRSHVGRLHEAKARCYSTAQGAHRHPFVWAPLEPHPCPPQWDMGCWKGSCKTEHREMCLELYLSSAILRSPDRCLSSCLILLLGELVKKTISLTKIQLTSLHNTQRVRQQWER